jgi:L-ascorbate metabolism protein UlaG (beta-lactamase superfamily)
MYLSVLRRICFQEHAMAATVIYHGHSNIEIHAGSHRIQIDPFYDSNPLADIKSDQPDPQYIFLSHAHFDHVDDAVRIAKRSKATIVANFEMASYYEKQGMKTIGMNTGGGSSFAFGRATLVQAFHTSTFADGTPGGAPGGWVIEIGGKIIYFAGDTAIFGDMALFGKLWKFDLACLPIGDHFTMGPDHALLAAEMLKAPCVLPIHYNTFPPIKQDGSAFGRRLQEKQMTPVILKAGEYFELQ